MIVGDSQVLVNSLLGEAALKEPALLEQMSVAQRGLQKWVAIFRASTFDAEPFAKQVPRSDNSAADTAANKALDKGTFLDIDVSEATRFLHTVAANEQHCMGILCSFDGAARGNPGPGASGICVWWGSWQDGAFYSNGLILQSGCKLGSCTNNYAEAHGIKLLMKTVLRLHYWLAEQLAKLTQHSGIKIQI